ncbi:MAG: hypothetical protein ABJN84_05160 [Flavobacteriaceae bacterium]
MSLIEQQKSICLKYNSSFKESPRDLKVGIAENVKNSTQPIHALRHFPQGDTTGWYIWAGEYSEDPDFFKPLHVSHLEEWCPLIIPYLGLDAGWRFLIAEGGNYIDVWEDLSLLDTIR